MADREMNGREQLEHHLLTWLSEDERPSIQDRAGMITSVIMEALDSWVEEQPKEEIKVGDRVRLKRKLRQGDGSMTDRVCDVADSMERIPAGDEGEVEMYSTSMNEAHVKFESADDPWYFHIDDLEKVHT